MSGQRGLERNDFLTDKLKLGGSRRLAAFALKGPGMTGVLTPAKMGKNGDQIQRLARSPAHVLIVQFHGQIGEGTVVLVASGLGLFQLLRVFGVLA